MINKKRKMALGGAGATLSQGAKCSTEFSQQRIGHLSVLPESTNTTGQPSLEPAISCSEPAKTASSISENAGKTGPSRESPFPSDDFFF